MTKSLWLSDTLSPGFGSEKRKAQVIVIGGGLTGLTAAWRLCREGRDVIVLEAAQIGSGTSGHTTGKITSQHHLMYSYLTRQFGSEKARWYAEANQWAVQEYFDIADKEGIACHLEEQSAYTYANSESESKALQEEYEAAVNLGLPCSLATVPFSNNKALAFHHQAQFHSREFMLGLAKALVRNGGTIVENSRVTHVQERDICTVTVENGDVYEGDIVIYATLFPILDHTFFALRLRPVLHHGIAFSVEKREFEGMCIGVEDISFRYFGDTLIVVGQHRAMGDADNPYEPLNRAASERFSVTGELTRWSAHDQTTPDRVPYIGAYDPVTKKRFMATGFGAWGISTAMVASKILADLIAGRENPWIAVYSPWRTGKMISMAIEKTKDVLKSLTKGKHLCSHMGCRLMFNDYDGTHDCPCHGSRYDEDGGVLWGPAVKSFLGSKKRQEE